MSDRVPYWKKLQGPRWQVKRRRILERDGFACLCCGATDRQLDVNHKWYRGGPWEVPDEALETLCHACHRWRTETDKSLRNMSTKQLRAYVTDGRSSPRKRAGQIMDAIDSMWEVQL